MTNPASDGHDERMITMDFDRSFERLFGHEGAFTRRREDRGNWTGGQIGLGQLKGTKFGISAAAYPRLDIENLTVDQAKQIYRTDYWPVAGCDAVPDPLKFDLFDFAVNSGPGRAAKLLQKTVGAVEDGSIGPRTLLAIGNMNPWEIRGRFMGHRLLVMASDPQLTVFAKGWLTRVGRNAVEV
jgi:lysozyme family protein